MGDAATDETGTAPAGRDDDGQEYLDRSQLDFDPDDGLYSGTAVDGTSEIPGPHENDGDDGSDAAGSPDIATSEAGDESGDGRGRHEAEGVADDVAGHGEERGRHHAED